MTQRLIAIFRPLLLAGLLLAAGGAGAAGAQSGDELLAAARELYNEGRLDEAIEAAGRAGQWEALAAEAQLVGGRARLERYRRHRDPQDFEAARLLLAGLDPTRLTPGGRAELLVGLAEALFLEEAFGAAAELFESVLDSALLPGPVARQRVLDWWATALDRRAQVLEPVGREAVYRRLLARMEEELRRDPSIGPASYWLVVSIRALGDLDRAWSAAIAGWLRAPLTLDRGEALRVDLDRLMEQALIPERARRLTPPGGDAEAAARELKGQWENLKTRWTPGL